RCRFTLGFHRANVKPLSVNTRPYMNDSGARFALARSRLSSRHGEAPREASSGVPTLVVNTRPLAAGAVADEPGHVRFVQSWGRSIAHDGGMTSESWHISERIDRSADEVYAYASNPANLPRWAPGLGS